MQCGYGRAASVCVSMWGVRVCDVYAHMWGFCVCVFVSVHGELCGVCLRACACAHWGRGGQGVGGLAGPRGMEPRGMTVSTRQKYKAPEDSECSPHLLTNTNCRN